MHQVEAKLEAIAIRHGNDGVRTRDLLAGEGFVQRNELAGLEMELLYLGDFEDEVADFGRDVVEFD